MLLEIDDWRTVGDLQYRFNKCFPFLHLEVYDGRQKKGGWHPAARELLMEDVRKNHKPGVLSVKSWYTKAAVEGALHREYGIFSKILLLSGDRLLLGERHGNLTLQELSDLASKTSSVFPVGKSSIAAPQEC